MSWLMDGDSGRWVEDVPEPGVWMGGGGDAPAFFVPTYAPQYEGGGGDAPGWAMPLSPAFLEQLQQQQQQDITPSFGGLPTNAQGSAFPVSPTSQLSTNPDRTQPFNFVANPLVSDANPFSKPINNAIQAYLGRPANALELSQYSTMLAKNPDDYGWIVNNIQNSPEAASAILQGKQNLIIDPRKGDMTNMWLGADYELWKPSEESGLSKVTNAIGSAIPFAALAAMTGGAGAAAGLGAIGAGALAGGVSNAARAAIEGGNIGTSALTGALTGALSGSALNALSAAPNLATAGIDLGSNFTWNLPTYEDILNSQFTNAFANPIPLGQGTTSAQLGSGSYLPNSAAVQGGTTFQFNPVTGQFDIPVEFPNAEININSTSMGTGTTGVGTSYSNGNIDYIAQPNGTYLAQNAVTGESSIVNSVPANAFPLNQAGPTYSELGYTPQFGPSYAELGYAPSLNTSPFFGFNPLSSVSSLVNSLTSNVGNNTGTSTSPGKGGDGTGGDGTGGDGTGNGGGGPGTGPGKVPTAPPFKFPTIPLPKAVVPTAATSSFYAPKGQVDYRPIIDLLGPRQILRNLF